jgi:hypothetical protein
MELNDAKNLVEQDRKNRLQKFVHEVQALTKKYNCDIRAKPVLRPDGTIGTEILFVDNAS